MNVRFEFFDKYKDGNRVPVNRTIFIKDIDSIEVFLNHIEGKDILITIVRKNDITYEAKDIYTGTDLNDSYNDAVSYIEERIGSNDEYQIFYCEELSIYRVTYVY